ncbi:MAG: AAA-like domain-containing protein [Scytonema sp. PMC 1069.18]|nr:AAA-like domain-containing protein [Scytonema sp. PMC 1069.18]MEC4880062.1 AAA-like domain-containing protein [Scytonema sp. PMC 1070.18]
MKQSKLKRRRGVLLTSVGLQRLQAAILSAEIAENCGNRFTLEELSDRVQVSTKTLSRLWSLNASVDQKTLKLCFSAFQLELRREDYTIGSDVDEDELTETPLLDLDEKEIYSFQSMDNSIIRQQGGNSEYISIYPDGPLTLDSPFYIERLPIERLVYQEITQPGSVIRIRAPRGMGKSSLVLRLLEFAQRQGYHTVKLDCQQIDLLNKLDLKKFLRCFCWRIAKELGIDPNLDDNWDEEIGSKLSCSFYLRNYLLEQIKSPIVLVLEQMDCLFEYPQLAQEFFPLLRSWYEEGRRDRHWQKLKLVVVYSTDVYVSLDLNRSPFNIGLPLRLPEFTQQQVKELAKRYGLDWSCGQEATQLMSLVGGHPALIQTALYYLRYQGVTLDEVIREAIANGGIYRHHLWQNWMSLQEKPILLEAYTQLITSKQRISLDLIQAYRLDSLGLVSYEGDRLIPRCELYRAYFQKQLSFVH